ncbi:hypothetical protein SDRG_13613 [Saprolegnia diclina VS20]|uniref:Uncharacterized protein n=1 Tax=Saprolegnia diclina (strain VS20) TaxID=1156394 RepID=T0Q547_SAPDV|nr:hypothetical protein SDRG_13613 [Saprolegnia diclina VS20]EQC28535.1 hypothetical protein SDRG_13613 [Saprolegnia diclina VS20]|eukprot:XP_008617932.1 hypothetical protein SDRG_13613 [Saprolegnia diclina VS20]
MDAPEVDVRCIAEGSSSDASSPTNDGPRDSLVVRRLYRVTYSDDSLKERFDQIVRTTLRLANATDTSNNVLLAQKAIKYRRRHSDSINYDDPSADVFESLGIKWCKTP